MPTFLSLSYPYTHVRVSLYKNDGIVATKEEHKFKASQAIILLINDILQENNLSLSGLDFIHAVQGPGPFNTLRAIVSSVNGIQFASGIDLVGSNALTIALLDNPNQGKKTCVVMKAFAKHVYYALEKQQGYMPIDKLEALVNSKENIILYGNGADQLSSSDSVQRYEYDYPSEEAICSYALQQWKNGNTVKVLQPLYLKAPAVTTK